MRELFTGLVPSEPEAGDLSYSDIKRGSGGGAGSRPAEMKLPDLPVVYDQRTMPICVSLTVRRGIELAAYSRGLPYKEISSAFIDHARKYTTPEGQSFTAAIRNTNGYSIRDAIKSGMVAGFPLKAIYPLASNYLDWVQVVDKPGTKDIVKLRPEVFADAAKRKIKRFFWLHGVDDIKDCLLDTGNSVFVAAKIYPNWLQYRAQDVSKYSIHAPKNVTPLGLHGFLLTGYRDSRNAWIADNSHGEKWGYLGRGFVDYEYPITEAYGFELEYEGIELG